MRLKIAKEASMQGVKKFCRLNKLILNLHFGIYSFDILNYHYPHVTVLKFQQATLYSLLFKKL